MNPIIFILFMLSISTVLCYSVIRYTNKAFQLSSSNIKPNLVINSYDDHFVEIATMIGVLNSPQDFAEVTKAIQNFQNKYRDNGQHSWFNVQSDVGQLLNLLDARTEAIANKVTPIHV